MSAFKGVSWTIKLLMVSLLVLPQAACSEKSARDSTATTKPTTSATAPASLDSIIKKYSNPPSDGPWPLVSDTEEFCQDVDVLTAAARKGNVEALRILIVIDSFADGAVAEEMPSVYTMAQWNREAASKIILANERLRKQFGHWLEVPPPSPPDPVGHQIDVHAKPWSLALLKDEKTRIVTLDKPYSGTVSNEAVSRDGKMKAFIVEAPNLPGHQVAIVCVQDLQTGKLYAVLDLPLAYRPISDLAWCDDRYLQFDRWSQPHYGMHYLIDTSSMKLVHATPFPDKFFMNQQTATTHPAASITQEKAADRVLALPEVRARDALIRLLSKGKSHGSVLRESHDIEKRGDRQCYILTFGEDQPKKFLRLHTFAVDAVTGEVLLVDDETDKLIPLTQWRKDQKPSTGQVGMLVTKNYEAHIFHFCEEGCMSCNRIIYYGLTRATGKSIVLVGRTMHSLGADGVTPAHFQGYEFENGHTTYQVLDDGTLQIIKNDKQVMVSEKGTWKY